MWNLYNYSVVKWYEEAQAFIVVGYTREMTAKKKKKKNPISIVNV